ncbi:MAG TPA: hypothetical protein VIG33_12565, partial [Pseudobdellovibrionaceae bacterium]
FTEPESSLRAVCISDDRAKSYLKKWDLKIENAGTFYKAQKPNSEVYFKIEKSQSSLPSAADMATCYSLANSKLEIKDKDSELAFRNLCDSHATKVTLGDLKAGVKDQCIDAGSDGITDKNILAMNLPAVESINIKSNKYLKYPEKARIALFEKSHKQEVAYRNLGCDKIKVEISKCNKEKCSPSDFAHFAGEFDKSLGDIDVREEKNKKTLIELDQQLSKLQQILKVSPEKELSDVNTKIEKITEQKRLLAYDLDKATAPVLNATLNEILNLNAFGKCCANSECKRSMFDKYAPSEPKPGRQ